jgi:hypothetical protein
MTGPSILSALQRPGNVIFSGNLRFVPDLAAAGGRAIREPSGHLVFYGPDSRRFLATDPDGHPLHECEWVAPAGGPAKLGLARVRLDWGQWVGLKPEGLVHSTTLDLSRKPGWERLRSDDLRRMAAQALGVPLEEVRFFYGDEDLSIDSRGEASIRHKKDALYVLEDGTFRKARFMACMGAMHWDRIDFLPVVELFQSLLPGTGSAVFELIRGLYDDQNTESPRPLRYRGIPTYPSEAAFRLFSAFFSPQLPGGGNPFPIFMDASRAHEVTWLPVPEPPERYFDPATNLCLTVKDGAVQKVTVGDDPSGLPYLRPDPSGFVPCDRTAQVSQGKLVLKDGERRTEIPVKPAWGTIHETSSLVRRSEEGWRALFGGPLPKVEPIQAFSAVLLYPEAEAEIDEAPTQPFVADHLQDLLEQQQELAAVLARATRVLIDRFDAALATCVSLDQPRDYTVLYSCPEFAQKHAQLLWNQLARAQRWDWMNRIRLWPDVDHRQVAYAEQYDLIYQWTPFSLFNQPEQIRGRARALSRSLRPGALAFITGPTDLARLLQAEHLRIVQTDPVETLPPFRMHQTILPKARLKSGLMLFQVRKG